MCRDSIVWLGETFDSSHLVYIGISFHKKAEYCIK